MWSGQPVALVIAETEAAAEDGAALVDGRRRAAARRCSTSRPRWPPARAPSRRDARSRAAATAARARTRRRRRRRATPATRADSPNVAGPPAAARRRRRAAGLARADAVVSGRFRTSWVHQAYLEPQSALAWVEPDGELVVHSSTQGAFMARRGPRRHARAAARPRPRPAAPIGGAFGGKLMISEPLAAAAALKLRRPVRIVFGRTRGLRRRQPGARRADRPRARRDRATAR